MLRGKFSEPQFKSLVQDPADSKIFYAGSWSNREPGTAVFKTTDGGKQWQPAGTGITSQSVTLLRSAAPGKVFAVGRKGRHLPHHRRRQELASRAPGGGPGPRRGSDQAGARCSPRPRRACSAAPTSGETWSAVTQGLKGDDVAAVAVSRDGQVFAGTFHGVFRSTDGGTTWTSFTRAWSTPTSAPSRSPAAARRASMPEPPAGASIRPSCPRARTGRGGSHLSDLVDLAIELELDETRLLHVDEPADRSGRTRLRSVRRA